MAGATGEGGDDRPPAHVAAELAFQRRQRADERVKDDRLAEAQESALRARIALRRNELARLPETG